MTWHLEQNSRESTGPWRPGWYYVGLGIWTRDNLRISRVYFSTFGAKSTKVPRDSASSSSSRQSLACVLCSAMPSLCMRRNHTRWCRFWESFIEIRKIGHQRPLVFRHTRQPQRFPSLFSTLRLNPATSCPFEEAVHPRHRIQTTNANGPSGKMRSPYWNS